MKVFKKGFEKEITCPKCRAVLLYVSNDIYHCGDLEGDYYDCVRCPECNTDININQYQYRKIEKIEKDKWYICHTQFGLCDVGFKVKYTDYINKNGLRFVDETGMYYSIKFEEIKKYFTLIDDKYKNIMNNTFMPGDFLYKLGNAPESNLDDNKRVFIFDGHITGDGYGVLLGFNSNNILLKSSGFGNYCYGADVRKATKEEIKEFINQVHNFDDFIKTY